MRSRQTVVRNAIAALAVLLVTAAVPTVAGAGKPAPKPPPAPTTPTTYDGRATALDAHVQVLPVLGSPLLDIPLVISDTGELGPSTTGGMLEKHLAQLDVTLPPPPAAPALVARAGLLNAAVVGSGNMTVATSSVLGLDLNVANTVTVRAALLHSTAKVECVNGVATGSGGSEILDLAISVAGTPLNLPISAPKNTTLEIPGLVRVVLNEQLVSGGRYVTNAVHVTLGGILSPLATAEVIISHADAGIACGTAPPPCPVKDFVTGGGWISLPGGGKGTFGMVGGQKQQGLQGHLTYIDHGTGQKVTGTAVTSYLASATDPLGRRIVYSGNVNGVPTTITADVSDRGEPGANVDGFTISSSAYSASGPTITKGNIQLHKPQGCEAPTKPRGGGKK